jgi:uncharacterized protein (DUF1330 family)
MPAYVVVQIEVTDPAKYEGYKQMVPPSIQKYGGRFLVRGEPVQTLEGSWSPKRFVIIQFDSIERAKAWWGSPEYRDAKLLRQASARTEMICVESAGSHKSLAAEP